MGNSSSSLSLLSPFSLSRATYGLESWLVGFARETLVEVCQQGVTVGHLSITDSQGTYSFGNSDLEKGQHVTIQVVNDTFWTRVLFGGDLGFSEAYLVGDIEISDLKGVIDLWLDNRSGLTGLSTLAARAISTISAFSSAFLGQTHTRSRLNVIASYDTSNALFQCFLSKEMQYSCGLWDTPEYGVKGDLLFGPTDGDLESAQERKLHHVLKAARVKPGDRVLEFGTGWGALAITAAKDFGCSVETFTLSIEQKKLAEERIRAAGLQDMINVHLCDYRDLPASFEKSFDAFVSIEMVEHVGSKHYNTYFKVIDWALKSEKASAVVTGTTLPEARWTAYQEEDFIRRYMWPNSSLPSPTCLITAATAASNSRLELESVENHGAHYPRTLRTWGRKLEANFPQWRDAVIKDQPALQDPAELEAFLRKWRYMFVYAAAGFAKGYITCHMLTWRREHLAPVDCA
ncbi:cyclopropane-fatty-acyl-phospholipid synthase [Sistotremastrum niveocremeum HHB9708]|uniref:Cyclopropane-fatty-acyl-phospholipid synthase n=1 Tax=Sistotremastrum niveocremeum HHB9708 TaxID=1314777 RepID=A0A164PP60_9AGAM|nr:cyclopropane-fatty-acyl-phospholipid synthase [Sistotremastrum niveocremeum HHB9708]